MGEWCEIEYPDSVRMSYEKDVGVAGELAFMVEINPFEASHEADLRSYDPLMNSEWFAFEDEGPPFDKDRWG